MRTLRLTDVVTLAALTTLIALPAAVVLGDAAHETNNRVNCAKNLKQIGMAIMLYANENRGKYPRAIYKRDAAPVWGTPYQADRNIKPDANVDPFNPDKHAPDANDVTAALFLLLRTQDVNAGLFVCPSSGLKPWDYGGEKQTALAYTNWLGNDGLAQHLSYSYANPYPNSDALANGFRLDSAVSAEFAVAADMNPGGDAVTTVTKNEGMAKIRPANSLNHGGDGQNVLFGDGHIEFTQTPFTSAQRDNIYTANGPELEARKHAKATIVASPADADDSVLLPTAADIGQKIVAGDATSQPAR